MKKKQYTAPASELMVICTEDVMQLAATSSIEISPTKNGDEEYELDEEDIMSKWDIPNLWDD